jgi:acetyl-CoA carboxylase biotin carboxyl carrier protein
MDIKEIRQLVKLMVESGLSELDISEGDNKVHLKRAVAEALVAPAPVMVAAPVVAAPAAAPAAPKAQSGLLEIKSPMVGTFYSAPSPDSAAYVSVGSAIGDDTVVCIVEAMKVMNEIKAECSGTVVEICVKNAQPVEFGQVLFRVKP